MYITLFFIFAISVHPISYNFQAYLLMNWKLSSITKSQTKYIFVWREDFKLEDVAVHLSAWLHNCYFIWLKSNLRF